jgi:hypothetical protein
MRTFWRSIVGLALALFAWPAAAAPIEFAFTATVVASATHPPGETWGHAVPIGTIVTGGYSFEVNPGNPEQAINVRFWFDAGTFAYDVENMFVKIQPFGSINWGGGDLYQVVSQVEDASHNEIAVVDLEALAGGALQGTAIDQVPDIGDFGRRAQLAYAYRTRSGWAEFQADLDELVRVVAVPAPATILVLLTGLAVVGAAARRRSPP